MKIILTICLFLQCSLVHSFEIKNAKLLKTKQLGTWWCWAATLEALSKFNGQPISQYDIIQKETNIPLNEIIKRKNESIFSISWNYYAQKYMADYKQVEKEDIEKYLTDNNKPVIFMANNHVSLIVGFKGNNYLVMNTISGKIIPTKKTDLSYIVVNSHFSAMFMAFDPNDLKPKELSL